MLVVGRQGEVMGEELAEKMNVAGLKGKPWREAEVAMQEEGKVKEVVNRVRMPFVVVVVVVAIIDVHPKDLLHHLVTEIPLSRSKHILALPLSRLSLILGP